MHRWIFLFVAALASWVGCTAHHATASAHGSYGENQARHAERALDDADQQLDAMEVDAAERDISDARADLKHPDVEYYPERDVLRAHLHKAETRLASVKTLKIRLERESIMVRQQQRVLDAIERLDTTLVRLHRGDLTRTDVERAREAFHHTRDVIADGRSLERQFPPYAKFAQEIEATLVRRRAEVSLGEAVLGFMDGPGASEVKARQLLSDAGRASKSARPNLYRQALTSLASCKLSGHEMLITHEHLDHAPMVLGGKPTTPSAITQFCAARASIVEKRLAEATREAQIAQARRVPPPPPRAKRP